MNEARAIQRPMAYGPGIPDEKFSRRADQRNYRPSIREDEDFSAQNAIATVGAKLFVAVMWVAAIAAIVYVVHHVWMSMAASVAGALQ